MFVLRNLTDDIPSNGLCLDAAKVDAGRTGITEICGIRALGIVIGAGID